MSEKLDIFELLGAVDVGGRDVWRELTDTQRSQVAFVVLNRWVSSVQGNRERQELAVLKTNEYFNKNMYDIPTGKNNDHRELLWKLLCMSGDTGRIERHQWVKLNRRLAKDDRTSILHKLKPHLGSQEVQLLAKITTDREIIELAQEHGLEPPKFK